MYGDAPWGVNAWGENSSDVILTLIGSADWVLENKVTEITAVDWVLTNAVVTVTAVDWVLTNAVASATVTAVDWILVNAVQQKYKGIVIDIHNPEIPVYGEYDE